jgi:hypothetical protein
LKLRLVESGPFAVWTAAGVPSAKNISFEDKGNGLWEAALEPGRRNIVITLSRAHAE